MENGGITKNKIKDSTSYKRTGRKIFLSLHIMPRDQESTDIRVFSWLTAGLLIVASLIIFLMIYV